MKLGRPQDKSSISYGIYVSGIPPGTGKCDIMSYFKTFGDILDVKLFDSKTDSNTRSLWQRHQKANSRRHFCILFSRDQETFGRILRCPRHTIGIARVFCEEYLTGNRLNKQNKLNNQKRAFIRKIPQNMGIDQLIDLIEEYSGPIESYVDFKDDMHPRAMHYSMSITFKKIEDRDWFYKRWESQGLLVLGERVIVEKYIQKKQQKSHLGHYSPYGIQYHQDRSLPVIQGEHTFKNQGMSHHKEKEYNTFNYGINSRPSNPENVSNHEQNVKSMEELLRMPKPTSKGYHGMAEPPISNQHRMHNIRVNVLVKTIDVQERQLK